MNPNIVVAPQFPDGEIVNAFLIRVLRYGGSASLAKVCRQLLRRKPGLDGMPSYIGRFYEELGYLYGDLETLINKHTEFNFFACGLPQGRIAAQRTRLIGAHAGPVRLCRLPLLFSVSENSYLRCPECDREQMREFGFTFIHRRHGAPFVNVCPIHGIKLKPSSGQHGFYDARCQTAPNDYQKNMTMELGKRIEQCMEEPAPQSKYHKDGVIRLLKTAGWIGDDGRFCEIKFRTEFAKYFAGAFADIRLEVLCQSERHVGYAARALLRSDRALHPEWCVLFTWFAERNRQRQLLRKSLESSNLMTRQSAVRNPLPERNAVEAEIGKRHTFTAAAAALGIATTTLITLCGRFDIGVSRRPKKLHPRLLAQIKAALEDGKNLTEVAKECDVSISTAWRQRVVSKIIPPSPEEVQAKHVAIAKHQWLSMIRSNPGVSTTALRKMDGSVYMRLYRGDKAWLESNKPARIAHAVRSQTSLPASLILCLNEALADAAHVCTAPENKRVNISQYRLLKLSRVTPFALQKYEQKELVDKREEDRRKFYLARILRLTGRPIKRGESKASSLEESFARRPSGFAKEVGLREESVRKVLKTKKHK
jgi:hypothetical protein